MGRLLGRGLPSRLRAAPQRVSEAQTGEDARRSPDWLHTARWQRLRLKRLERDGYICQQTGVQLIGQYPEPSSPVVDHKIPHRGNPVLFWDEENLQSVSKEWHDKVKQGQEKRGEV